MSSAITSVVAVALLVLAGCSSDEDADAPPPAAPEALFGTLPPASPNKLRGVYSSTVEEPSGTVEIRVRFQDRYVVGAGKCTFVNASVEPIIAGGSVGLDTTALDAATGKVTFSTLAFEKKTAQAVCQAGLRGATYDFKVEEDKLTLTVPNAIGALTFKKIGD